MFRALSTRTLAVIDSDLEGEYHLNLVSEEQLKFKTREQRGAYRKHYGKLYPESALPAKRKYTEMSNGKLTARQKGALKRHGNHDIDHIVRGGEGCSLCGYHGDMLSRHLK